MVNSRKSLFQFHFFECNLYCLYKIKHPNIASIPPIKYISQGCRILSISENSTTLVYSREIIRKPGNIKNAPQYLKKHNSGLSISLGTISKRYEVDIKSFSMVLIIVQNTK